MKLRKWTVLDTYIVQDRYDIEAYTRIEAINKVKNTANIYEFSQQVIGRRKLQAELIKTEAERGNKDR